MPHDGTHDVVTIDQAEEEVATFHYAHDGHGGAFWKAGEWGVVLSCPECKVFRAFAINNEAYREARTNLREKKAVTF